MANVNAAALPQGFAGSVAGCRVDRAEALRYLGYAGQEIDAGMDERIDAMIATCEREARPGYAFASFPLRATDEGLVLEGSSLVLSGADIAVHLAGACACTVMACTLGLANEVAFTRLKARNSLDAMLYGSAGSSLVESVADICETAIVAAAAQAGLRTNWRYSPGYGDLPLSLQPSIVRVLGADKRLGLTATASNLLIPAKSVTAIVGLFDASAEIPDGAGVRSTCSGCSCREHCTLRAAGTPCWKR